MVDHKEDPVLVVVQLTGGGALSFWFVTEMETFLQEN